MSESIVHESVARQIADLSLLADSACENFQHQVINSKVAFTAPTAQPIFNLRTAENTALVITSLEIKVLYDTTDAALVGDFRSTFDLNPYGPYVGAGGVGQIGFLVNGVSQWSVANPSDFGVINMGILLVVSGDKTIVINANPFTPIGKNVTLVSRLNTFIVVPESAAVELQKKTTRIVTHVP